MIDVEFRDELVSSYWDFYKEVYNVRPRWIDFNSKTVEEMQEMLSQLTQRSIEVFAERDAVEKDAIVQAEKLVLKTICDGAPDRETALRWIADAYEVNGDMDYLCYKLDVPYGYFGK